MTRWMILAVLTIALPAAADRPHGPPPGGHGPMGMEMSPEDRKTIHDYKLTTGNTDKLMEAHKRFRELAEKDPSLHKDGNPMAARTIDESVKRVEAAPEKAKAILKDLGLSSREFVVGTFTMMTAAMWHGMQKRAVQAPVPEYVNPDNLKFVEAHPELVQKWRGMGPGRHGKGEGHDE